MVIYRDKQIYKYLNTIKMRRTLETPNQLRDRIAMESR